MKNVEEAMRRWWREHDFSDVLNEVCITAEKSIDNIVGDIERDIEI